MKTVQKLLSLDSRVAIITGGGGHIGSAMADALGECGASVAVLDIADDAAERTAQRVAEDHGVNTLAVAVDLEDEDAVRAVPANVVDQLGSVDIVVNCAAFVGTSGLEGWAVPFEQQSAETWRRAMEVNLTAPFVLVQACAPHLEASGHGSVINIGSIYGIVGPDMRLYGDSGLGNPAAYAASKGGLMQLTRWMSTVMAPHTRVNAISIGGVFRGHDDGFVERYTSRTPLDRMATEEDLKGAAVYLASDLSSYVTGHNLVVDGGWSAW